jgi:sugar phosphate isomerase/epimerase
MKIGLHAAMLERRFPNPVDALAQAAALGADSYEIDLGIGRPGETWASRAEVFRQLVPTLRATAARTGLELSSLCLGTLWQTSLASPDPGERMQGVRLIRDVCALAQPLGAAVLLLPIGQPEGVEGAAARANAVMSLRECLAAAEDTGVTLALENVCQPFLSTAEEMLEVITDLDSPVCGIYYDLGNPSFIGRDPVAELRTVAPHLVRVHAKDTVGVPRERPPLPEAPITGDFVVWQRRTTVTLGTGEVNLSGCAQVLREIGYTAGVVTEVPQPSEGAEAGCRDNLAAARRIFEA